MNPYFLRTVDPQEMIDMARPPNQNETMEIARTSVEGGANVLVGGSFQKEGGSQF